MGEERSDLDLLQNIPPKLPSLYLVYQALWLHPLPLIVSSFQYCGVLSTITVTLSKEIFEKTQNERSFLPQHRLKWRQLVKMAVQMDELPIGFRVHIRQEYTICNQRLFPKSVLIVVDVRFICRFNISQWLFYWSLSTSKCWCFCLKKSEGVVRVRFHYCIMSQWMWLLHPLLLLYYPTYCAHNLTVLSSHFATECF